MTPSPLPHANRPSDHRVVPLLGEHDLGHYPQFRAFLTRTFGLDDNPFGPPGLLQIGNRIYEITFVGRSGRPFPDGAEIGALVPGLEPLDETAADRDLWAILHWLVDGAGGEWTSDALTTTGRIYRIPAATTPEGVDMKITNRKILITCAGSGIGRELALRFGSAGGALALVGRRADALEHTAAQIRARGGTAHVVAADLADRSAPDVVVAAALEHLGGLDVLINNAGNVRAGELESLSQPDIEAMVDVDLLAPVLLTRAALPHLRVAGEALVLGIASGIALVGLPYYSVYAAVKAGLAHFDESLRRELLETGVRVVTVFPGATATPMMDSSTAGEDLGFGRRPVTDVVDDIVAGIEADHLEINTALQSRRALQELNRTDVAAVDAALRPRLAALRDAVSSHRSI